MSIAGTSFLLFLSQEMFQTKENGQMVTTRMKMTPQMTMIYNFLQSRATVSHENITNHLGNETIT